MWGHFEGFFMIIKSVWCLGCLFWSLCTISQAKKWTPSSTSSDIKSSPSDKLLTSFSFSLFRCLSLFFVRRLPAAVHIIWSQGRIQSYFPSTLCVWLDVCAGGRKEKKREGWRVWMGAGSVEKSRCREKKKTRWRSREFVKVCERNKRHEILKKRYTMWVWRRKQWSKRLIKR